METPVLTASVDAQTQRLRGVPFLPSPNQDARPPPADAAAGIDLLVIHAIALPPETFGTAARTHEGSAGGYIDDLFLNRLDLQADSYFATLEGLHVSAHLCIFRDGHIHQYVPFDRRAWHAGVSQWDGRERCNDFSIGIELEGSDTQPFEDAQYEALAAVTRALQQAYPRITSARIVGHSDVAPGRKTDPGPHFDWPRYRAALATTPEAAG